MLRSWPARLCPVAIALLGIAVAGSTLRAAEIECINTYQGKTQIPEELLSKLWPSGFRPIIGMCSDGLIHGTITKGDFEKVREFYRRNHRVLQRFYLDTAGGDVIEAINIGTMMRKYLMSSKAPGRVIINNQVSRFLVYPGSERALCNGPDCVCASACALMWFGSVNRDGAVGLHRPRIDDPSFTALSPAEAARVYRRVLDDIARYMEEVDAKDNLERPPSFAEWEDAVCGSFSKQEEETITDLDLKSIVNHQQLTPEEELLRKLLWEKQKKKITCEHELRYSRVDQLPPP
jgi:hypothetical protein